MPKELPKTPGFGNETIDLAILLEPIYWPRITGRTRLGGRQREEVFRRNLAEYRDRVLAVIRTLDPNVWGERHASLRCDAGWIEKNGELYVLLRIANWEQRVKLEGRISGALWIRHIGEVIRRAFEEVHGVQWPEEDQAFSFWHAKARRRAFGCERSLDDKLGSKPHLAYSFGLFTGSAVRWYLEGETEYYAVLEMLPHAARFGIVFVNLAGAIKEGRGNAVLKLEAMLRKDKAVRRFSMISIDGDVPENTKAIRIQVLQDNIVGSVVKTGPFWADCRELISDVIGKWLIDRGLAHWPKGNPPKFEVELIGPGSFRVKGPAASADR